MTRTTILRLQLNKSEKKLLVDTIRYTDVETQIATYFLYTWLPAVQHLAVTHMIIIVLLFAGLCYSIIRECNTLPLSLLYILDVIDYTISLYVIVISQARGMYSIYCTEARGRLRPRAEVNK